MNAIAVMIPVVLLLLHAPTAFAGGEAGSPPADRPSLSLIGHTLALNIDPASHRLSATDAMVVNAGPKGLDGATFHLSKWLKVASIVSDTDDGDPCRFSSVPDADHRDVQLITIQCPRARANHRTTLRWRYDGPIDDPPREPRHLRFVTPSETSGHIGPEGAS
jgi:aminopeptidase N